MTSGPDIIYFNCLWLIVLIMLLQLQQTDKIRNLCKLHRFHILYISLQLYTSIVFVLGQQVKDSDIVREASIF